MRITIDNLDGLGAVDYSGSISDAGRLKVNRDLNQPSTCECVLDLSSTALRVPLRKGRMIVQKQDGTVLFTGYIATEPELVYAGMGTTGALYRSAIRAISDEWLLDRQSGIAGGAVLQQSAAEVLDAFTTRAGGGQFTTSEQGSVRSVGIFEPEQNKSWSVNAGSLAGSVYAAYRAVAGTIGLQPAGTVTHSLSDVDGSVSLDSLRLAQTKELANDVTISGEMEPAGYVSESFAGDGSTSVFTLAGSPFRHSSGASSQLISDSFDQAAIDPRIWNANAAGAHFSLTPAGLTMNGGNGLDGQTTLEAADAIEVGGTLVLEMGSVQLNAGSDGVVCGLYGGNVSRSTCMAGYNVRQSNGKTVIAPLVNGVETGTVYTVLTGHTYTLRIRVHCVETQRVGQIYYAMVDGAVRSFGGGVVDAPVNLVFDLQDLGLSLNTPATVLYDGSIQSSAASCTFAPVNSIQLFGSAGYCRVTQTGSAWVTKTSATGVKSSQLAGTAGEGVDCTISVSGQVTFLAGRAPQAGEMLTVSYRSGRRSITRMEDAGSVAQEAAAGVSGTARWIGKVVRPLARSTVDCESAAAALLSVASDRSAATSGTCVLLNPEDMWPGDVLSLNRAGETVETIVRSVRIEDGMAAPEYVTYHVAFASEWADGLGIKLSEAVATDVVLPQVAQSAAGGYLPNLQQLRAVGISGTVLQIDTGIAAPTGGGFEVRRRDGAFGTGIDQDLVLRSPVRAFSLPREGQIERYYVRMYDGSTPPVYSRFSSAIFTDIPVG